MVLDNQTANIRVGDQVGIPQTTRNVGDADVVTQSVQFRDTGVLLEVTPRVNSGGLVTMDVSQEVTDLGPVINDQPSFLQRTIRSTVAVQSGETIVLGGLIRENQNRGESGVPGLYKLPVVGKLFGQATDRLDRAELVVLLTPRAVRNEQEARRVTEEYRKKLELLIPSKKVENAS